MNIRYSQVGVVLEFSGGPVGRTRAFTAKGLGSIPDQGNRVPQAARHSQKKKVGVVPGLPKSHTHPSAREQWFPTLTAHKNH